MDAPQLFVCQLYEHTLFAMFVVNGLGLLPDCSDAEMWSYFIITQLYEPIDRI